MASAPTAAAGRRVPLRSIERGFTLSDDHWFMVGHVMLVRGQTEELVRHLPTAVMQTFNRHPRMRMKLLKNEFATGEIQPRLTLDDVSHEGVLAIKHTDAAGLAKDAYTAFVQEMAHTPYDRYAQFAFRLHVWVDAANDQARLILFSDHYASDGKSGTSILNDVLAFASASSRSSAAPVAVKEMALRESLYDLVLEGHAYAGAALRFMMQFGVRALLRLSPTFSHVIPPNTHQQDFRLREPPKNPSRIQFADGSKENLARLLAKCRAEGTTFFGAFAAAIFLSYILAANATESEAFKLGVFVNLNMRERVARPVDPEAVGCFITASEMATPTIHVPTQRFWDLARALKRQSVATAASFATVALPLILLDQHFHRASDPTLWEQFPIRASNLADVDISSLGRYAFPTAHAFRAGEQAVETLNYTGHVPFLATACLFYATSVEQVGYSMSHHYDEATGKALFDAAVAVVERAWQIASDDSLADVAAKLVEPAV